jgi:hypothetical protein
MRARITQAGDGLFELRIDGHFVTTGFKVKVLVALARKRGVDEISYDGPACEALDRE